MKIGIGITTRGRSEVLKSALDHFLTFQTPNSKVVVIEDDQNSDKTVEFLVSDFKKQNLSSDVAFFKAKNRLGIAKAKNACLYHLSDCDHIFLFDDDAWPKVDNWAEKWIEINKTHNVGHSMWITYTYPVITSSDPFKPIKIWESTDGTGMSAWSNCMGLMLYFTRQCLDAIGGYDYTAPNVYGFEHAQISMRANKAGFCLGYNYLSPTRCRDLIFSFDVSYGLLNEEPPLEVSWKDSFRSSVTPDEHANHRLNFKLLQDTKINIPLADPLS